MGDNRSEAIMADEEHVRNNGDHIPVERMKRLVGSYADFMNHAELLHIQHCGECITLFGKMMLSNEQGDAQDSQID